MEKYSRQISDYEITDLLGKGGFAMVYRARCRRSDSDVAIKMIDIKLMKEKGMMGRVLQEVSIHSKMKHPSIVELYCFFEDSNYVYLILELCERGDLKKYLSKRRVPVLSESETSPIVRQVVEGLMYLHSNRIVHRDMSLANLLLTAEMNVKLSDFGLATQLTRLDEKHMTMCGTPNYISPEVATSASHGLETDIWGLGVMLYTMLVGKPPFDHANGLISTLTCVVISDIDFPKCLSTEAKTLISCLLKKNPQERIKLQDILVNPFLIKNSSFYRPPSSAASICSKTDSSRRWMSYDSGVASSYQSSAFSQQSSNSSRRLPILNGALQNTFQYPSERTTDTNPVITCCNGHLPNGNRGDECSHCNPLPGHRHNCYSTSFRTCSATVQATTIQLPKKPSLFNSRRLQPIRQKTKNVIVNILDTGEVCLEFTRYKEGQERVNEVLRISIDGTKILVYQPNFGKGSPTGTSVPSPPLNGSEFSCTYDTIPEKHWKKYSYAARFVDLVKTKTPKVTFYSKSAKCFLMENGPNPDFEACFYEGGKITKSKELVKLIDFDGESSSFDYNSIPRLSATAQLKWEHFGKCLKHCQRVEDTLEELCKNSEDSYFPIIIGRRPIEYARVLQSTSGGNKENLSPTAPSMVNVRTMGGYEGSVVSGVSNPNKKREVKQECYLPGAKGSRFSNGDICVEFKDGSKLTLLNCKSTANILYTTSSGEVIEYKESEKRDIPLEILDKLSQARDVLKILMPHDLYKLR